MPWRVKRIFYLFMLAMVLVGIAVVVFVRHRSVDSDLLAVASLVGAAAVLIVALPNGNDK